MNSKSASGVSSTIRFHRLRDRHFLLARVHRVGCASGTERRFDGNGGTTKRLRHADAGR